MEHDSTKKTDARSPYMPHDRPRRTLRRVASWIASLLVIALALIGGSRALSAQTPDDGNAKQRFDLYQPAPPAVAPYYPYVYQGERILQSATVVDEHKNTVTLPLYQGRMRVGEWCGTS